MSKLPARYMPIVFAAIMSIFMAGFMSAIVTAINTGIENGFLWRWLGAYAKVLPIAFIAIMLFRPLAMKIAGLIVETSKSG
jgi:hypothetical protein